MHTVSDTLERRHECCYVAHIIIRKLKLGFSVFSFYVFLVANYIIGHDVQACVEYPCSSELALGWNGKCAKG
jgi:hypothetical protein